METKAVQIQDDQYHLACQNCGTTTKPLQMIPLRDDNHVVGLVTSCDDCRNILYGQKFDREKKPPPQELNISNIKKAISGKCINDEAAEQAAQAIHDLVYGEKPPKTEG